MAVIRVGEVGYQAYIYVDGSNKNFINISTPSYTGVVDLTEATKVLALLIKLKEVPADIMERLFKEVQECLTFSAKKE